MVILLEVFLALLIVAVVIRVVERRSPSKPIVWCEECERWQCLYHSKKVLDEN